MKSRAGDISIVFNGEIYNYMLLRAELEREGSTFVTHTDTEVILQGYERHGRSFFERLRGMWAFCIYDAKRGIVVLSRDAFGIKPLLYSTDGGELYFASEMRALKSMLPKVTPNTEAYFQFFNLGYFIAPDTCYREVRRLRPGEILTWDVGARRMHVETLQRPLPQIEDISFSEAVERTEQALSESIGAHFVADVPVGLLLSGGNDSSLIAALSTQLGKKPLAYTLEIQGSIDAEYAQKVAKHLGLEQERIPMTGRMFAQGYAESLDILDEPFADSSIIPTSLIYRAMRGKTKVVLSGEGGDELFGGYTRHRYFAGMNRFYRSRISDVLFEAYGSSSIALRYVNPVLSRARRIMEQSSGDLVGTYLSHVRLSDIPIHVAAMRNALVGVQDSTQHDAFSQPASLLLDRALYLPYDLLYKTDMASMASSIEARVPYLDVGVLRTLATFSPSFCLSSDHTDKELLKKITERYLPRDLVYRPKKGFGFSHETYAHDEFARDVGTALEFHAAHAADFGLTRSNLRMALRRRLAGMFIEKYPAFAFALVTNWRVFGR